MAKFVMPAKMKDWSLWALWWLLLGGAVLWLLVGSVAYWVKHGWLPPGAAGWVQAVGSVAAIVVAIYVPYSLRQSELQLARQELVERDIGMAARLWKEVQVLHWFLENVVDQAKALDRLPENLSSQFESMLVRFTQGFNDELNPERIEILVKVRKDLSSVIRILSDEGAEINAIRRTLKKLCGGIQQHYEDAERHLKKVDLAGSVALK